MWDCSLTNRSSYLWIRDIEMFFVLFVSGLCWQVLKCTFGVDIPLWHAPFHSVSWERCSFEDLCLWNPLFLVREAHSHKVIHCLRPPATLPTAKTKCCIGRDNVFKVVSVLIPSGEKSIFPPTENAVSRVLQSIWLGWLVLK